MKCPEILASEAKCCLFLKTGDCKVKARPPKVKGERKKKHLFHQHQHHLQAPQPPLPQPPPPAQQQLAEDEAPAARPPVLPAVPTSSTAEKSSPPAPLNVIQPSEAPVEEDDFKPRPIIPMLYVVPRTKKVVFDKERMSCQQAFEQFATQKSPSWQEETVPMEISVKEEENAEAENTEVAPEVSDLQVCMTKEVTVIFASFKQQVEDQTWNERSPELCPSLQRNSAVLVSHRVIFQDEIGYFLTVQPIVQSIIALVLVDESNLLLSSRQNLFSCY